MAQTIRELFSKYLDTNIFIYGLDALLLQEKYQDNLKQPKKQTVFLCIEKQVSQFLNSISENLRNSHVIWFELEGGSSFQLSAHSLKNYAAFIALELEPYLQSFKKQNNPDLEPDLDIVLVGQQFSAIVASYTAASYRGQIGGTLSLSGSYYWKPKTETKWEWLTNWFIENGTCPPNLYLLSSVNDTLHPPRDIPTGRMSNQNLYNVLRAKGCNVNFKEYASTPRSHEFLADLQDCCEWLLDQLANASSLKG